MLTANDIRRIRETARMDRVQFANAIGVPVFTVDNWERGSAHPSQWEETKLNDLIPRRSADLARLAELQNKHLLEQLKSPVKSVVFPGGGGAAIDVGTPPSVATSSHTGPSYTRAVEDDFINSGLAHFQKAEYDQAIADFSRAIEVNPDAANYYKRGLAFQIKADYDRAIADFSRAIEIDPNFEPAYFDRDLANLNKADYDQAIADFSRAITLKPDSAAAHYDRGIAYRSKADADFSRAIEIDPTYKNILDETHRI